MTAARRRTLGEQELAEAALSVFHRPSTDPGDLETVAEIKRAAPIWPPPVGFGIHRKPVPLTGRPFVVLGGLTSSPGCANGAGAMCVTISGPEWICDLCGEATPVPERVVAPRLTVCDCPGRGTVCVHPRGTPPPQAAPDVRPTRARDDRAQPPDSRPGVAPPTRRPPDGASS